MNKRALGLRVVMYALLLGLSLLAIQAKKATIIAERKKEVTSPINEWKEHGKPVSVLTLRKHDFHSFTKVTANRDGESTRFISHLSQETRNDLKVGQQIYYDASTSVQCGTITAISSERNLDTGMFEIVMDLGESSQELNHREIVFIKTSTIANAIQVPYNAMDLVGQNSLVRLVKNGQVVIKKVRVGKIDREAIVVSEGLQEGDQIILEGKSLVSEGDHVAIKKEVTQ